MIALASLLAASAAAATLTFETHPLPLRGHRHQMLGPRETRVISFDRDGWITGLSARVEGTGPLKDQTNFCHTTFDYGRLSWAGHPRFTLNPGLASMRFPDGFGFFVKKDGLYSLDMMVKNDETRVDDQLRVRTSLEFRPAGEGAPLKNLLHLMVRVTASQPAGRGSVETKPHAWWVGPGTTRYETVYRAPISGRIHAMYFHLHRYARDVEVLDRATGRVLFKGRTTEDAARSLTATPEYSDAAGLPLAAGQELVFRGTYEVPEGPRAIAMATLHLFVHGDAEAERLWSALPHNRPDGDADHAGAHAH